MFGLQRSRAPLCNETAAEHSDTHSDVSARRLPARLHPRSSTGEMRSNSWERNGEFRRLVLRWRCDASKRVHKAAGAIRSQARGISRRAGK